MYKIAVMGSYDSIYGFTSLGLSINPAETREEGIKVLRELVGNEYAVIYITEALAEMISDEINKHKESFLPAIILIPGVYGNTGEGIIGVSENVEKAVGSDILFGGLKQKAEVN